MDCHSYFFSVAVQIDGAKDGKYCWFTCYSLKGNKHSQGKGSVTWFTHTQMHSYPKKINKTITKQNTAMANLMLMWKFHFK